MPFIQQPKTDPDERLITCEVCGKQIMLKYAFSPAVVYRMPGYLHAEGRGAPGYQCPDTQHFCCSHEHAMLAMFMCFFEHIHEGPHAASKEITHPTLVTIKQAVDNYIEQTLQEREQAATVNVE